MVVSHEHRTLDGSLPHKRTSKTPFPGLKLSLSALSVALLIYLRIRLSRTSEKRKTLAKETNSRASSGSSYEVFLSFRGPDTRHGFTDCLYHAMVDAGILVFRDDESLRVGKRISDELLQAIENSKIYIPIFSKNYAASHWCLQELAYMVDCTSKSNENKEILPIFLDVEPDDVKLKTNLYKKALSKHQKKFCIEAIESWKMALIEVDEIKGWNLKKDDGQGDLIRLIIRTVSVKLKVAYENVTENLVGVDNRVEAIIQKLDEEFDGVQFLSIHGMGGVGKTTLAKVIFNKLSSSFDGCCFLADIGESSKGNDGLVNLQKQLLSKLVGPDSIDKIYNVNDGINMINRVLKKKKVLIILDDVDEKKQLKSLAGKGDWFGPGSKIIITTRDQSILMIEGEATSEGLVEKSENVLTYDVQEMEFDHALKLFSRHAFRRDSPPKDRVSLSKEIVHTLGNLPLAIEIIGSSLTGKSETLWIETWNKLKEAPPMEVQRKLKITYDRLEPAHREVFLDIACFFVNEKKTYPIYMWDACGYHPHDAIQVLFLMSLIKLKDDNTLWMHDQVRDLGREIIRIHENNFIDPYERSRVWKKHEALSILKHEEGSTKIKAMSLGLEKHVEILRRAQVAPLRKLRFFRGDGERLVGDFNNILPELRWLSWKFYSDKFEATNFHPIDLLILDLSQSNISEKWIGWKQIREARKLKVLDISYCKCLRTPDFSTWVYLERLVLTGCYQLIEIDPSIGMLKLLIALNLKYCSSLQELPKEIGCLQALTKIDMPDTLCELPEIFGNLRSLLTFDVPNRKISKLPYSIGGLVKIRRLDLAECTKIKELPDSVGKLQSLVELDLSSTNIGHLPDSIGDLKQLKVLRMRGLIRIMKLPSRIWLLEKLEELDARGCCNLTGEIPKEIGKLSHLRILELSDTRILGLPATVSQLSNLPTLRLEKCPELKQLLGVPPNLTSLIWGPKNCWCSFAEEKKYEPEEFAQYVNRAREEYELEIERRALEEYGIALRLPIRIGALSQQETLVSALPTTINTLSQLETLKLGCKNVQFLPQLPSSLRELQLRDLATIRSPDFSNLKNLSILTFYGCSLEFSRIFDAESEELRMELCELRQLDAPLQLEMKRLRLLEMAYCEFLPEVLDLSCMKNLHKVSLRDCLSLVEICGLEELGSLCNLSVVCCPSLERMSDLSKLKTLQELKVILCPKLKRVQGHNHLESLKVRRIYGNGGFGGDASNANSASAVVSMSPVSGYNLSFEFGVLRSDLFFGVSPQPTPLLSPLEAPSAAGIWQHQISHQNLHW